MRIFVKYRQKFVTCLDYTNLRIYECFDVKMVKMVCQLFAYLVQHYESVTFTLFCAVVM